MIRPIALLVTFLGGMVMTAAAVEQKTVALPAPAKDGTVALERALSTRRSVREFAGAPISINDVGQLLWAAQGITSGSGRRTAPSAGALYPLELYVIAGAVDGLEPGVYRYDVPRHSLDRVVAGDQRAELSRAARGQESIARAAVTVVIAAVHSRTSTKYGTRAERYCAIEAGCASQNLALQAANRGLGSVVVGAFDDARVREVASMRADEMPLILMPVGKPKA